MEPVKIKNAPLGVEPQQFRAVVLAAALVWKMHAVTPTASLIQAEVLQDYTHREIESIMQTPDFAGEMIRKGLPWGTASALSERQLFALQALSDPLTPGGLSQRLSALGVSPAEYLIWKRNPLFAAHLRSLTADVLSEYENEINVAVVSGAVEGRLEHIKYLNELTGKFGPAARQGADIDNVIRSLLEIIARHVVDGAVLDAIARDVIGSGLASRERGLKNGDNEHE